MDKGAKFEKLIADSYKHHEIYFRRIKTRITKYKGDNEIADFYAFRNGNLLYLEAKSTGQKSFPLSMLRAHQAAGLYAASKWEGVHGGVILEMTSYGRYFYIPIEAVDKSIQDKRFSFNIKELEEYAYEISKKKYLEVNEIHDIIES